MKLLKLNTTLLFCAFALGISGSATAQDASGSATTAEIQPFALIDNKITFYSEQIDFASVQVESMDGTTIVGASPVITISADQKTITLEFTPCESGEYLISGNRGDLKLEYSVEHVK